MEKHDVALSDATTPTLLRLRAELVATRGAKLPAGTHLGGEESDGSRQLLRIGASGETEVAGAWNDILVKTPAGRATINFNGGFTTLYGTLRLDEVEKIVAAAAARTLTETTFPGVTAMMLVASNLK